MSARLGSSSSGGSGATRSRRPTALAARILGAVAVVFAVLVVASGAAYADPPTTGPVFPAPGSGTWTSTGTPTGGEIGKAGGITWSYSGVDPTQFLQMVWGLGYPTYPSTYSFGLNTATFAYDSADSNLAGGTLIFSGSAEFPNLDGSTPSYPVRLVVTTLTGPTAFEPTTSLSGISVDPSAGGVLPITGDFSVNLIVEVSTDGGTTWTPANDYFNNTAHTAGVSTSVSVYGDFWYTSGVPAVSFEQNPLAFGGQAIGSTTQLTETVNNTGTGPLLITEIDAGGDYTAPSDTCVGTSVPAGGSCMIDVDFTPSVGGTDDGSLILTDNAPDSPQTLPLTGSGNQPQAMLSPNPVNFGTVAVGSSDQETLSISNPGAAVLQFTNASLSGADPGDFMITGASASCAGEAVQVGGTCMVTITFTPGGAGTRSATLTLTDNASPTMQSVTLTGVGSLASASVTPSNLDLGSTPLGNSGGSQAATITSTGTSPLDVTGYTLGGADPSDFAVVGGSCPGVPFSLAPGSACTIHVVMTPSAVGPRSATVSVMDDALGGAQQVLVGGQGTPSADVSVFITPSAHLVKSGKPLSYHVVVKNAGPSQATGVILTDSLPAGASFVSSAGSGCATPPVGGSGTITCSLGAMAASSHAQFTFVVKFHAKPDTTVINKVHVSASTHDPNAANNVAKVAITVK